MVMFLSAEWVAELDRAAAASGVAIDLGPGERVTIEQVVSADGSGEGAVYHLVLGSDGAGVELGPCGPPTVRFTTDRATAVAIYSGEESALGAFRMGRLEVQGDLGAVERHRSELDQLDQAFRSVRAVTEI